MKHFKRYFSVLCCFVLLSIGFSTIANAEEVEVKPYNLLQATGIRNDMNVTTATGILLFEPNNGSIDKFESTVNSNSDLTAYWMQFGSKYISSFLLQYIDSSIILEKGKNYTVRINNIYHSLLIDFRQLWYVRNPESITVEVTYIDGTTEIVTNTGFAYLPNTPYVNINFEFTPSKDVTSIGFSITSDIPTQTPSGAFDSNGYLQVHSYLGEFNGDDKYQFSLEVSSEESGLLKSLIEWVKGIKSKIDDTFTSITNGFSNIANSIGNVVNNIIELPSKLWTLISDGLKNLFVPTKDEMEKYQTKWDSLLSSRLGAIYEVGSLITDFGDSITESDKTNIISMPHVSLESVGIPFSFGGVDVQIVPDGFNTVVEICKKALSIACTFLFVNGLRRRYDEVMGVEK